MERSDLVNGNCGAGLVLLLLFGEMMDWVAGDDETDIGGVSLEFISILAVRTAT